MKYEHHRHTRIPDSAFIYKFISWTLGSRFRPITMNAQKVLTRMGVQSGQTVLEVGCGPGYFTLPAAGIAEGGRIYALDLYSMMIRNVNEKIEKKDIGNIKTLNRPASNTGLRDQIVDLILCIDVLSDITDINPTLREFYRVLKTDGILSVYEPHTWIEPGTWKPERSIKELTTDGLFSLQSRDSRILKFEKIPGQDV